MESPALRIRAPNLSDSRTRGHDTRSRCGTTDSCDPAPSGFNDNPKQGLEQRLQRNPPTRAGRHLRVCGPHDGIEVHHIRHLKDHHTKGRVPRLNWVMRMAALKRKTLVVCRACREGIHYGQSQPRQRQPRTP
jgi:hypothetical protein